MNPWTQVERKYTQELMWMITYDGKIISFINLFKLC